MERRMQTIRLERFKGKKNTKVKSEKGTDVYKGGCLVNPLSPDSITLQKPAVCL